jgi:hypothetical protein
LLSAFKRNHVDFELLDIGQGDEALSQQLLTLTGGNLSVPTVQFPDGVVLVEPSIYACVQYIKKNYPDLIQKNRFSLFSFCKKK